jgi:hypothetical protein
MLNMRKQGHVTQLGLFGNELPMDKLDKADNKGGFFVEDNTAFSLLNDIMYGFIKGDEHQAKKIADLVSTLSDHVGYITFGIEYVKNNDYINITQLSILYYYDNIPEALEAITNFGFNYYLDKYNKHRIVVPFK